MNFEQLQSDAYFEGCLNNQTCASLLPSSLIIADETYDYLYAVQEDLFKSWNYNSSNKDLMEPEFQKEIDKVKAFASEQNIYQQSYSVIRRYYTQVCQQKVNKNVTNKNVYQARIDNFAKNE